MRGVDRGRQRRVAPSQGEERGVAWRDVARPTKQAYLWVPLEDRRTHAYTCTPLHTHTDTCRHVYAHILYAAPSSQRQTHFGAALTKLFASQLERKQIRVCGTVCMCLCVLSLLSDLF